MDGKVNLHIYQSPFQHESRILRITKSLSDNYIFDEIIIIATYLKGLDEIEKLDEKRTVYRIRTLINPSWISVFRYLFLLEWSIRIILKFRKHNVVCVNAHSVPGLPIAYYFNRKLGAKFIYDTHEIETEQYKKTSIKRIYSKLLEKSYIKYIDYLFATSNGYARWYQKEYGLNNVAVVKNFSVRKDSQDKEPESILRTLYKLNSEDEIFIYQGIFAEGRGIELLLNVFTKLPLNKNIVFMGFGPLEYLIKRYTEKHHNIHFHPAVKPSEVYRYVQSCNVGLCIIENVYLSYYYTLPNKMLECLNAGIPVIVSNFPDMYQCVSELDCGWSINVDFNSLYKLINEITPDQIKVKSLNACEWAKINTWESQELILSDVYRKLFYSKQINATS